MTLPVMSPCAEFKSKIATREAPIAIVNLTDHSSYNYRAIVGRSQLVVDTRNATRELIPRTSCAVSLRRQPV